MGGGGETCFKKLFLCVCGSVKFEFPRGFIGCGFLCCGFIFFKQGLGPVPSVLLRFLTEMFLSVVFADMAPDSH